MSDFLKFLMPDFLGIGAQRAGTTWVWKNLNRHPSVWTPSTKEKHFFDIRDKVPPVPGFSGPTANKLRYGSYFLPGRLMGRTVGEVTPNYALLDRKYIRKVHDWMPDVKLIYVLRDPLERMLSKAHKDFRNSMGIPFLEASEETKFQFFTLREVIDHSRYGSVLENWLSSFGPDQLHVLFTEDIKETPETALRDLYEFLDLDPDPPIDWDAVPRVVHESKQSYELTADLRRRLGTELADEVKKLESMLDRGVPWPQEY